MLSKFYLNLHTSEKLQVRGDLWLHLLKNVFLMHEILSGSEKQKPGIGNELTNNMPKKYNLFYNLLTFLNSNDFLCFISVMLCFQKYQVITRKKDAENCAT